MSLLRLLSTGKSLVGLTDNPHRYRLTQQRLLPCFGSKKNPFRSRIVPSAEKVAEPVSQPASQEQLPPAQSAEAGAQAALTGTAAPAQARPSGLVSRGAGLLSGLFAKRAEPGRCVADPKAKPLVQGELSLERVKVVRNDLSDSDLEVVEAKPAAEPQQAGAQGVPAAPVGGPLVRVGRRLFRAGKA